MQSDFFPLKITDLNFRSDGDPKAALPLMPVEEHEFRIWLARGLLSGWASLSGRKWGLASRVVERSWELHRELCAKQLPPGHVDVATLCAQLSGTLGSSTVYLRLEEHEFELSRLGVTKYKGRWAIPGAVTSEAISVIVGGEVEPFLYSPSASPYSANSF